MRGVAWYDVPGSGWVRDIWVLSHFPYTVWFLSYVVIGAAMAPVMSWGTLGWTLLAFALAMGIGAHCLDEFHGRPLRTKIPGWALMVAAGLSIAGAVAIGTMVGLRETIWVLPSILFGSFIVVAYTLEWGGGFFHHDYWFGFAWGAFPVLTAYIAQAHTLTLPVIWVAIACVFYSLAQRVLSTQVRFLRRKVYSWGAAYMLNSDPAGTPMHSMGKKEVMGPPELALQLMTWAVVVAAIGLLMRHL